MIIIGSCAALDLQSLLQGLAIRYGEGDAVGIQGSASNLDDGSVGIAFGIQSQQISAVLLGLRCVAYVDHKCGLGTLGQVLHSILGHRKGGCIVVRGCLVDQDCLATLGIVLGGVLALVGTTGGTALGLVDETTILAIQHVVVLACSAGCAIVLVAHLLQFTLQFLAFLVREIVPWGVAADINTQIVTGILAQNKAHGGAILQISLLGPPFSGSELLLDLDRETTKKSLDDTGVICLGTDGECESALRRTGNRVGCTLLLGQTTRE